MFYMHMLYQCNIFQTFEFESLWSLYFIIGMLSMITLAFFNIVFLILFVFSP